MAGIAALAEYDSENSSNSGAESDDISKESCLHLKPLDKGKTLAVLQAESRIIAAPLVATKVSERSNNAKAREALDHDAVAGGGCFGLRRLHRSRNIRFASGRIMIVLW